MFGRGQSKRRNGNADPHQPHTFVRPEEARSGDALFGVAKPKAGMLLGQIAVTGSTLRAMHCALQGCRKGKDDPIHWRAD
jgi:hypothetical protein